MTPRTSDRIIVPRTFPLRTLLLALVVAGFTASSALAQEYKEAFNDARAAAEAKNYSQAYTLYAQAASGATSAGDQEVADMANKVLAQLDRINGNNALKAQDYATAKTHFEKGVGHMENYAANHYGLGLALKNLDQIDAAMASFEKAIEIGSSTGDRKTVSAARDAVRDYYFYEASSRLSKQNPSKSDAQAALDILSRAVEPLQAAGINADEDSDYHYYRGVAQSILGQTSDAITSLQRSLELHHGSRTDRSKIHFALAEAFIAMGQTDQAKAHLTECVGPYKRSADYLLETL